MTSETRIAYGSRVRRHGRSRPWASYQARTAACSAAGGVRPPPRACAASRDVAPTAQLRGRLVGLRREQLAAHVTDLVAHAGGVLEAQLLGGGEHLLLELDDRLLELGERHRLGRALRGPPAPLAALARQLGLRLQELGDVRYPLDDRRGRDPVLLVVGELDRAAAVGLRQ